MRIVYRLCFLMALALPISAGAQLESRTKSASAPNDSVSRAEQHQLQRERLADIHDAEDLKAQKDAAAAAARAAQASEDQTRYSLWQLLSTVIGTAFLVWSINAARKANKIALHNLDLAREISHAELRPWISFSVVPSSHIDPSGKTILANFKIGLKNIGRSPATGVWISALLWPAPEWVFTPNYAKAESFHKIMSSRDGNAQTDTGTTILPNEEETIEILTGVTADDLYETFKDLPNATTIRLFGSVMVHYTYLGKTFSTERIFSIYRQIPTIDLDAKVYALPKDRVAGALSLFAETNKIITH